MLPMWGGVETYDWGPPANHPSLFIPLLLCLAYQLITVVIAAAGGGLLLILGLALIVTCCR